MSKYFDKIKRILVITPDAIGSTYFQRSLTAEPIVDSIMQHFNFKRYDNEL
jgi:hypothetical protein